MKAAIKEKASRYGRLHLPYIIAVNAISKWGTNHSDVMEALFGSEELFISAVGHERMERKPDGVWQGPKGPQCTRVSAVLVTTVVPWNVPNGNIRLYHNPFAKRPCSDIPWRIPQAVVRCSKMERTAGPSLGNILGLPVDWPGRLFD
jgi:hypothetical protein